MKYNKRIEVVAVMLRTKEIVDKANHKKEWSIKADALPLETVLGQREQWGVPVYQRHYGW